MRLLLRTTTQTIYQVYPSWVQSLQWCTPPDHASLRSWRILFQIPPSSEHFSFSSTKPLRAQSIAGGHIDSRLRDDRSCRSLDVARFPNAPFVLTLIPSSQLNLAAVSILHFSIYIMPSTHRRRDSTVELSRVGGVY